MYINQRKGQQPAPAQHPFVRPTQSALYLSEHAIHKLDLDTCSLPYKLKEVSPPLSLQGASGFQNRTRDEVRWYLVRMETRKHTKIAVKMIMPIVGSMTIGGDYDAVDSGFDDLR
jgi:hypothetical protein